MFIPSERLPPGFAERLGVEPASPSPARPAATVVLLRAAHQGPEVLLLRRNRSAGFVPGAWVFPGGRAEAADADPRLFTAAAPPGSPPPPWWAAAVRELFEETGVLLALAAGGGFPGTADDPQWSQRREALLADRATLHDVLESSSLNIAFDHLVHCAHWITPIAEPRRFDTHFFLAALPDGATASPDPREMSDAIWLAPRAALDRFTAGRMPMVFPTVRTLESIADFRTVDAALDAFRGRAVSAVLPRLVRRDGGVALVVDPQAAPGGT
jgi:8-oxo-dGTP pyrophosphatase MutT (NUDIX family)